MAKEKKRKSLIYRGEEGMKKVEEWEKQAELSRRGGKLNKKFKLAVNSKATGILIDDACVFVKMHTGIKVGNGFHDKVCISELGPCPPCEEKLTVAGMLCAGTLINRTGFVNDDDERIKNYKQLLMLKGEAKQEFLHQRSLLEKKYGKDDPLKLTIWKFRRGKDPKSINTGVHFECVGRISKARLIEKLKADGVRPDSWEEFLKPFNYEEIFAPEDEETLRAFLGLGPSKRKGKNAKAELDEEDDYDVDDDLEDDEDEKSAEEDDDDDDVDDSGDDEDMGDEEEEKPKRKPKKGVKTKKEKPEKGKKAKKKTKPVEDDDDEEDDDLDF